MAWHCHELEARSEANATSDVDPHDFELEVSAQAQAKNFLLNPEIENTVFLVIFSVSDL